MQIHCRTFLAIAFTLFASAGWVQAQSSCTVQEAPVYRGLKLGMTRKHFLARFPGTKPVNVFNREELSRVQGFGGIEMLAFRVSENKLDQIEVRYAGLSGGGERLTRRVARELGLPQDAWKTEAGKSEMTCLTFRVVAEPATNGFTLSDLARDEYWKRMRERTGQGN